jgi:hypothetical protein
MNKTEWSLELKISDGPSFRQRGMFYMEGVDRIDVVVPAGSSKLVNVNCSELDEIKLVYIARTDEPQAAEDEGEEDQQEVKRKLYYMIGEGTTKIYLSNEGVDPPELHVVLGPGAIRLLCDPPNELCFTNEGDQDADVTILICRETTRDCEPPEKEPENEGEEQEPEVEGPKGGYPPEHQEPADKDPKRDYPSERQEPRDPHYPSERQQD